MPTSPPSSPGSSPTTPEPAPRAADTALARRHAGWEHAYATVRVLAVVLLLPTSLLAAGALSGPGRELAYDMKMELPAVCRVYFALGPWITMGIGQGVLLLILGLGPLRSERGAVVAASVLLVLAMFFLIVGLAAAFLPFRLLMESIGAG